MNERLIKAVLFAKENDKITNSDYQKVNEVSKRTATTELIDLVEIIKFLKEKELLALIFSIKLFGQ